MPLSLGAPAGGSGALPGPVGPGSQRRTRRHRTIFSEEQLQALEALFVQNQYPDVSTRERLAGRIRLREERVEVGAPPSLSLERAGRGYTALGPGGRAPFAKTASAQAPPWRAGGP